MVEATGQETGNQDAAAPAAAPAGDWRTGLEPDIANHPSLGNFKSPADLAKSWVNAQKLIGADKIPVPGENATPEEWNLVHDRLGRPASPEGYTLPDVEMPQGMPEADEGIVTGFKAKAHELGILPNQAAELFKWYREGQAAEYSGQMEQRQSGVKEAETALRSEWGKAYDTNLGQAQSVLKQFGDDSIIQVLEETGLGNNPAVIKMLANIGKNFGEDGLTGKGSNFTMSPEEAKAEINAIMANKDGAYFKRENPEHKMMVDKVASLHAMAYPEEATQG